jgi:hypothetical protein
VLLLFTHVDNVHWCCSLSTDVWVLTHRKGTCRVLLHVSAAWSWRQHHDWDRCAAVFIISFVSTVLLSLRHVADIVSWLLHVLMHAGVRPTLEIAYIQKLFDTKCVCICYTTSRHFIFVNGLLTCKRNQSYLLRCWIMLGNGLVNQNTGYKTILEMCAHIIHLFP